MIKFRLYPEKKSLYFLVCIYDTKQQLQKAIVKFSGNQKSDKRTRACVLPFDVISVPRDGWTRKKPILGVILFWKKDIGTMILAHEIFHATLAWMRRMNLDATQHEERLAVAHGEMCRQFAKRCYAKRLYET